MTDYEIIKALECHHQANTQCEECPAHSLNSWLCFDHVISEALKLIKRQKVEIEGLSKECDELVKKIEQLLCNVTGDKLSKHTYPIEDMLCYADDYTNECCEEAVEEAKPSIKSEAVKELAERLCKGRVSNDPVVIAVKAELKEMTEESENDKY